MCPVETRDKGQETRERETEGRGGGREENKNIALPLYVTRARNGEEKSGWQFSPFWSKLSQRGRNVLDQVGTTFLSSTRPDLVPLRFTHKWRGRVAASSLETGTAHLRSDFPKILAALQPVSTKKVMEGATRSVA